MSNIDPFRLLLLFADGVAMVCAIERMMYYRKYQTSLGVYHIYGFFLVLSVVYLLTTFSDLAVISKMNLWWAETPIVRGLVLRVPVAAALLWMSCRRLTGEK